MLNNPATNQSLPINNRTVFVDTNAVRISRGISAPKIREFVECGELLWVWNVASPGNAGQKRNMRFWLPDVVNHSSVAHLKLDEVIARILPRGRDTFNGSELSRWFLIAHPTVIELGKHLGGEVRQGCWHFERESLVAYLRAQWIGGGA